jgi:hypothetical protein
MALKTFTAPSSITISDSDNNRISVLKSKSGIQVFSHVATGGANRHMTALQETIKSYLLNLVKSGDRDNYKIRFAKLAKLIQTKNAESFPVLNNHLSKEIA